MIPLPMACVVRWWTTSKRQFTYRSAGLKSRQTSCSLSLAPTLLLADIVLCHKKDTYTRAQQQTAQQLINKNKKLPSVISEWSSSSSIVALLIESIFWVFFFLSLFYSLIKHWDKSKEEVYIRRLRRGILERVLSNVSSSHSLGLQVKLSG